MKIKVLSEKALCLSLFAASWSFLLVLTSCANRNAPNMPVASQEEPSGSTEIASSESNQDITPFYESVDDPNAELAEGETPVIGEEVEEEINKNKEPVSFDYPIVINAKVEKWLDYFQGKGRKFFRRWLSRSGRYIPMMKGILRENGLPEDLIYLAMIESGFKPYAYSRARASGPWQFIKRTGANYGLKSNWWIDERRDPKKSTIAAAAHLKDLYDQFKSWHLAAAGYNAGAGKISRAIRRYSTEDFWEISKGRYLRRETKNYVPKIIAAALIAKEPAKYGFSDIQYDEPITYDEVNISKPTELVIIADELGISLKNLKTLNPELRRGITPPNYPNYELKIPTGTKEKFQASYEAIRKKSVSGVAQHKVRSGESLWVISRRYGITISALKSFNSLRSNRLRPGQKLAIPFRGRGPIQPVSYSRAKLPKSGSYRVRRGDSLWSISRKFSVTVNQLRSWNGLRGRSMIRAGQTLRIVAPGSTKIPKVMEATLGKKGWLIYNVRRGDTLWEIAIKYQVRVSDLSQWNKLANNRIKPGQKLRIRKSEA